MPRKPRFVIKGVHQHVIQRGNNQEPCFFADMDYRRYLDTLQTALEANDCVLHAYVLMTNHVHLLITPFGDHGVSHTMQDLGRKYVTYINRTYKRTGTLWEGRYKASLVDSEAYLLTCMRYIELNPIRACMVTHPGDYKWSSYQTNAQGKADSIITPHPLYLGLDADPVSRLFTYRELFRHHLDRDTLHDIRDSLNQELVLGRDDFKDKIEATLQRQTRRGQDGRPPLINTIRETEGHYYVW